MRAARFVAVGAASLSLAATFAPASASTPASQRAALDRQNLRLAAQSIVQEAVDSGALPAPISLARPAKAILLADQALLTAARHADPSRQPQNTIALMGSVPYNLKHQLQRVPRHARVSATHTLLNFRHPAPVGGSAGLGMSRRHSGSRPAPYQKPDGVYVDPYLPSLVKPSIAAVALRTALGRLGQPYVWGAAGSTSFDCSGLVRWAYGHAGLDLAHYTGDQWNEGRHIPPSEILPGDLIFFYNDVGHVGIYLGAGWMVNAPYTGQYVSVEPVFDQVAGVVRP